MHKLKKHQVNGFFICSFSFNRASQGDAEFLVFSHALRRDQKDDLARWEVCMIRAMGGVGAAKALKAMAKVVFPKRSSQIATSLSLFN